MSSIPILNSINQRYVTKRAAKNMVRRGEAFWADDDRAAILTVITSRPPTDADTRPVRCDFAYDRAVRDGERADRRNLRGIPMVGDIDRLLSRPCRRKVTA